MKNYVCTICGFIYDESSGYPEGGIQPGTVWDDVPASFKCPLCGASKSEFREQAEEPAEPVEPAAAAAIPLPDEISYTEAELSAIFSNLEKGCEKQYDPETAALYGELAAYYGKKAGAKSGSGLSDLNPMVEADLSSHFTAANGVAGAAKDRGALRALKWAEQVTRMTNAHLARLEASSSAFLEDTHVYVCEICGFIFIGDEKPAVCPVCKVPNMKMTQIQRGA